MSLRLRSDNPMHDSEPGADGATGLTYRFLVRVRIVRQAKRREVDVTDAVPLPLLSATGRPQTERGQNNGTTRRWMARTFHGALGAGAGLYRDMAGSRCIQAARHGTDPRIDDEVVFARFYRQQHRCWPTLTAFHSAL